VIIVFFLIDIGLCFAYILNFLIYGVPDSIITDLLDLDGESSLGAWYSSIQYFCAFVFSAIYSYFAIRQNRKLFILIFLPMMFLFMSIDESVQIHEWLGEKRDILFSSGSRKGTLFGGTGLWMFLFGLPFLALFLRLVYLLKQQIHDKKSSLIKLVVGMLIMLTGALGFETLSNFVVRDFLAVEIVFEEGLEMIGATVMLWAVYEMAKDFIILSEKTTSNQ